MKALSTLAILIVASAGIALLAGPIDAQTPQNITVTVGCFTNPETVTVANNTGSPITVLRVGSLHLPRENEPFSVSILLQAGASVSFQAHDQAPAGSPLTLTRQEIFNNEVASEGVLVETTAVSLQVLCSAGTGSVMLTLPPATVTPTAPAPTATQAAPLATATRPAGAGTLAVYKDCFIPGPDGKFLVPPPPEGNFKMELLKGFSMPQGFALEANISSFNTICGQTVNFTGLAPGSYSVFEVAGDDDFGQIANFCINVNVEAGRTTSCNLTNEKLRTRLRPPATGDGGIAIPSK